MIADFFNNKLNDLKMYMRFCFGLRGYLKEKIAFEDIQKVIKKRMGQREENFLKIIRKGVFANKKSPYLALLKLAQYEYNDIERLVSTNGIEGALRILKDDGVYFKINEFKGKSYTLRKGKEFSFCERDFDNPYVSACYERRSGGTRSPGTRIMADFDYLSGMAINRGFIAEMYNLSKLPHIIIRPAFPYGVGMMYMLQLSKFGIYPLKWISLVDEKNMRISLRNKLGIRYIFLVSKILGKKFPNPEFINLKDLTKLIQIVLNILRDYKQCCIFTNVSTALRICLLAKEMGVNLTGTKFEGCGEPLTETKHRLIQLVGAKYILYYAFAEAGLVGVLCSKPSSIDDVHLFKDSFAVVSYEKKVMDYCVNAFLFTNLLPSAPKILLNVESGDYGVIERRSCGCACGQLGFNDHIHHVRSFEKLTGEGMTFYGTDLIRIVEEVLPVKFGGSSLDYQLIEEEDSKGITNLIVFVSPVIGNIDESSLAETIIRELKKRGDGQKMMAEVWSQAKTIKVKRNYPVLTKAGKLYPLYILPKRG